MRGADHWQSLHKAIDGAERFLLTSHLFPDGDSIGSEVALALHLRSLGKEVVVRNETCTPERYAFLTRLFPVESFGEPGLFPASGQPEVSICLDVSSWDYMGAVGRSIRESGSFIIAVDHHQWRRRFGDLDVVLEGASSTGEVLYRYFRAVGAKIDPAMATALYASLLFDTGGLRNGNSCNETVHLASELLDLGVDHRATCAHLFETDSWSKIDLLRLALGTLRSECEGRLAWLAIPQDLYRLSGALFMDGDGILDQVLDLQEVEICVMFRQLPGNAVKATFRSKGGHDVGKLAEELGGGGRATASGVLLPLSLHEAMERVLPRVHHLLANGHAGRELVTSPVSAGSWSLGPEPGSSPF